MLLLLVYFRRAKALPERMAVTDARMSLKVFKGEKNGIPSDRHQLALM